MINIEIWCYVDYSVPELLLYLITTLTINYHCDCGGDRLILSLVALSLWFTRANKADAVVIAQHYGGTVILQAA